MLYCISTFLPNFTWQKNQPLSDRVTWTKPIVNHLWYKPIRNEIEEEKLLANKNKNTYLLCMLANVLLKYGELGVEFIMNISVKKEFYSLS